MKRQSGSALHWAAASWGPPCSPQLPGCETESLHGISYLRGGDGDGVGRGGAGRGRWVRRWGRRALALVPAAAYFYIEHRTPW